MDIETRATRAIEYGIEKKLEEAMNLVCPAIEATARAKLAKPKITGQEYKDFLRDYYWLLERFSGEGLNFGESSFPDIQLKSDDGRTIEKPDFADVIYHLHRCTLAHGHTTTPHYSLIPQETEGHHVWKIGENGDTLQMPEAVLWALIALIVFCEVNRDIVSDTGLYLTWGGGPNPAYRFYLDVFWGAEATVRTFFAKREHISVAIKF